jgi:SagB-type dehydrogenase family enzyme
MNLFRAAGSAGARFPLEVYVSTREVGGVPDGVHWYDPVEHALVQVGPAASGDATTIAVTGIPWRTGWRYAERGWRHVYWDAGTMVSQILAAAASAGLAPRLRTEFPDAAIRVLVGADDVHEHPLALVTIGEGIPAIEATARSAAGLLPRVELPLCTSAQQAGERDTLGDPWPDASSLAEIPPSDSLDEVILRRGSKRLMDRSARLPRREVEWMMRAAMRGIDVPHWVVAHGVDGVTPGIYRWPDLDEPVRAGDLRDKLDFVCVGQTLGADAVFVVISAIGADVLDDRSYRRAQLAAGIVEGRLHLAAYALGAAATGMTFYDSEIPALLDQPDDVVALLFTCVGVGEYTSRSGGSPGAPVEVRPVTPRVSW